jgi:HK97 family phage portal protein
MRLFRRKPEDRTLSRPSTGTAFLYPVTSAAGATVTPESALAIADAWACIRALADAASSLPLKVYRAIESGREELPGSRAAELLRRPAPGATQAGLVAQIVCHLQTHGNCFVGKVRIAGEGTVEALWCLPPGQVTVELRDGLPVFNYVDQRGRRAVLTEADVIHLKGLSMDGVVGMSPVRQAREALGLNVRLLQHSAMFFANDSRPPGILRVPAGPESQDSIESLREAWEARHQGAERAHRIAVVSGDVEFQAVGLPMEDAEFVAQRRLSATEIARVFRVPPWIIGAEDGGSMTYANVTEQVRAFLTFSVRPWLTVIEQALSADRDLFSRNTWCAFLDDAVLKADHATRAGIYEKALDPTTGWLTRDEVRRLENLPPEHQMARQEETQTNA